MKISYEFTKKPEIPAIITRNGYTTPIWIQQMWEEGEFSKYVQKNGCGHCCTSMALCLNGIEINPHEEFSLCRELWGEPRYGEPFYEDNFASVSGIVKILKHFGVNAKYFGVSEGKTDEATKHIKNMLDEEKMIIIWSQPSERLPENPFSPNDHYVLLLGYDDVGQIVVANSSANSKAVNGINKVDLNTIKASLCEDCEPDDYTWGRHNLKHSGGYVVIG